MKLYIKYMVSIRCKMAVKGLLDALGIPYGLVDLGEVTTKSDLSQEQIQAIGRELKKMELELMDDKKSVLIENLKKVVIEMVHFEVDYPKIKHSDYISQKLKHNYTYLADFFSESMGMTIEHFIISHKIEKVKELLLYDELSLTEISYRLQYSSVAHLSTQFKKVTGLTPTFFKKLKHKKRSPLEKL